MQIEQAKLVLRQCQLGIELDRVLQSLAFAGAVSCLIQSQGEVVIDFGVVWLELQGILIRLDGAPRITLFEKPVRIVGLHGGLVFLHALLLLRFKLLEFRASGIGLLERAQNVGKLEARLG